MATSLAQQLERLAVPQTSLLQRDKKRASLLFDPKEAAGIDKDTFFDIGISGLKELIQLNPEFVIFENSLFSSTSKQIERAVENKDINIKLNKNIRKFLLLLSPYFLLKPSHKALEWLIYRFSIHDYNKDECMELILPYHETNIFVKFLQILNIRKENDKWHWLRSVQKSGVHLPKLTLFNHASSNPAFLQFIGEMALQAIKENGSRATSLTTMFSFYCVCTVGALEHTNTISEPQMTALLPTILRGMGSNVPDFIASTYMVTARLLKLCKPSVKILNQLVNKLVCTKSPLVNEAALLLVLVFQTQEESYAGFPEKALRNVAQAKWLPNALAQLSVDGAHILPLVAPLLKGLIDNIEHDQNKEFFNRLILELTFNDENAEKIIMSILDNDHDWEKLGKHSSTWFSTTLRQLENRYPSAFDRVIAGAVRGPQGRSTALLHYLNIVMSACNTEENIFEKIHHPNASLREEAVMFFVKNFPKLNDKEKQLFNSAIQDRLLDDNKSVVEAVLNLNESNLNELLGEKLEVLLIKLLKFAHKRCWYDISMSVLTLLCKKNASTQIFVAILPHLLPTTSDELIVALHILKTEFSNHCSVLKSIKSKAPREISPQSFCESLYESLREPKNIPDISLMMDTLENNFEKDALQKYLSVVLVTCAVPTICHTALAVKILNDIYSFIDQGKLKAVKNEIEFPLSHSCIISAKKGDIPLQGILLCLENLIEKVIEIDLNKTWLNFSAPDDSLNFIIKVFTFLLDGCNNKIDSQFYGANLAKFFKKYFPTYKNKIEFLSNFLIIDITDNYDISTKTQLRALKSLNALLQNENNTWFLDLTSKIFIPALLICLANSVTEIRSVAIKILQNISKLDGKSNSYIPLIKELEERKEEIMLDNEQLSLILFSIFEDKKYDNILKVLVEIASDYRIPLHVNAKLLKTLTFVNSYDILESLSIISLHILDYIGNDEHIIDQYRSGIVYNVILRLNENTSKNITLKSSTFALITKMLKHDIVCVEYKKDSFSCPAVLVLEQISRDVFSGFSRDVQGALVKLFCEVVTNVENPEVVSVINKVIRKLELDAALFVDILVAMRDAKSNRVESATVKRRRTSVVPTVDILRSNEWAQGVAVLEFIQDKKRLLNCDLLLPILFGILKKCLEFDEQASLEYPKQLILCALLQCCEKVKSCASGALQQAFNMELVVQCVRASPSPQTHHHALLLLAKAAELLSPDVTLHNVMALFTFVGSSVLRHDDAYSFQVISRIIDNVIPVIVHAQADKHATGVLRVFADVILDIPEHRRLPTYTKLLTTLGLENHLSTFLLLIFESHVLHGPDKQKHKKAEQLTRLNAANEITLQFDSEIIMKTNTKLLDFLKTMPQENTTMVQDVLNLKNYTPKQFRHYKYTLVTFMSELLTSKVLVDKLAAMNDNETLKMEGNFKDIIINILTYIQTVTKISESSTNSPQAQYWRVMLHHCYDILDSVNALLTKEMFLLVIRGLVVHNIFTVRRKALELLNTKLQHEHEFFAENENYNDLLTLLPPLLDIVKNINKENDSEAELIQQTALLTLKLLIKLLAERNVEKFTPLLDFMSNLVKTEKINANILASIVLCLAELVSYLRAHAIPSLIKFMPAIIKVLKLQKNLEAPNLLLMCIITAIQKIIDSLPLFLSPYLEKLLFEVCVLSCWEENDNSVKIGPFLTKLAGIRSGIGNKIPSRVLIPIIGQTYEALLKSKHFNAIGSLTNVLSENLGNVKGSELVALLPELTSFFLKALEFRNVNDNVDLEVINTVEGYVIKSLVVLVLKLSESTFRPFYYKLYDWAIRCEVKNERIITFYRLSAKIADNLKSLFSLFAGHFVKNAANVLEECNSIKDELYFEDRNKCAVLAESVLQTLTATFTYDAQGFVDRDRFEVLLQPLVDQIENNLVSEELVVQCVGRLASCCVDDSLWKRLQYAVLLKARGELVSTRLRALASLAQLARTLAQDFLPLLPETIPFLAELLEDEDETVEKAAQDLVREMEEILGEPLQKYF